MKLKVKDRQNKPKKVKQPRIYLTEPHDYFGVKYVLKMQERQRQLAKEGLLLTGSGPGPMLDCFSSPKPVNGIVPSKCWRAYDLHNKPRGLYSEEEKKIAALEASYYRRTAVSVPLKEVLTNKLKGYFSRLTGKRLESEPLMATSPNCRNISNQPRYRTSSSSSSDSDTSSIYTTTSISITCMASSDNNNFSSKRSDESPLKKHVHFAPQTVFCERDDRSRFWTSSTAKRSVKSAKKADKEETLQPRPFLPFLESGLSYYDDAEFYRLKNSNAHRNPQIILAQRNSRRRRHGQRSCWQAVRHLFCCCFPKQMRPTEDYYDWSRKSGNAKGNYSYRTRKDFREKYL